MKKTDNPEHAKLIQICHNMIGHIASNGKLTYGEFVSSFRNDLLPLVYTEEEIKCSKTPIIKERRD